jgi:hypothetical protein
MDLIINAREVPGIGIGFGQGYNQKRHPHKYMGMPC